MSRRLSGYSPHQVGPGTVGPLTLSALGAGSHLKLGYRNSLTWPVSPRLLVFPHFGVPLIPLFHAPSYPVLVFSFSPSVPRCSLYSLKLFTQSFQSSYSEINSSIRSLPPITHTLHDSIQQVYLEPTLCVDHWNDICVNFKCVVYKHDWGSMTSAVLLGLCVCIFVHGAQNFVWKNTQFCSMLS